MAKDAKKKQSIHVDNRKARFEYEIMDRYEAGIVLLGTEIKSIRLGHVGIAEAYAYVNNGEVFVKGLRIDPLENILDGHEATRVRKLLLHKYEIAKIEAKLIKGTTLVVTRLYINDKSTCKLEIAVAKGKKLWDKRETIKKRDVDRDVQKSLSK